MADYILDAMEYLIRAALLLYLLRNNMVLREKYRSVGKVLFFVESFAVSFWTASSPWVRRLLYGDGTPYYNNSAYSIFKITFVFICGFVTMDILYRGRRITKFYLLAVFYIICDMTRLTLHSVWLLLTQAYGDYLNRLAQEHPAMGVYVLERYQYIHHASLFLYSLLTWIAMYAVITMYKRFEEGNPDEAGREGMRFMLLAPTIGIAFDVAWRVIFYSQKDMQVEFLYDRHASMYVVFPAIALLCMAGIVMSRKIYTELLRSEQQKSSLLFYKQQLADMTAHVRELEQLYDGIRGMRHDINNYIADMEQLLQMETEDAAMPADVQREAARYLRRMQSAVAALSFRFSTGNPITDVILNRKAQLCERERIAMEGDFVFPEGLAIEAFDLGIVLNNALDNAIEACRGVEAGSREIRFRSSRKGSMFFLTVDNPYAGEILPAENGGLRTTKTDDGLHGLGMGNMLSCAEKYFGTVQYEAKDGHFTLTVMMQGAARQSDRSADS